MLSKAQTNAASATSPIAIRTTAIARVHEGGGPKVLGSSAKHHPRFSAVARGARSAACLGTRFRERRAE